MSNTPARALDDSARLSGTYAGNYKAQGDKVVASNSVATRADVDAVAAALDPQLSGSPHDYIFALVMACRDQGSSFRGTLEGCADANDYHFSDAARVVRRYCTLRQLCMFYAPAVWNYSVDNDDPPANWIRAGYTYETRFAAFDFFRGVTHSAAITLPTGLSRPPTTDELRANSANAMVAIRASRDDEQLTTQAAATLKRQVEAPHPRPALGWY